MNHSDCPPGAVETMEDPKQAGLRSLFDLSGRVAVITGGAGLLGLRHAQAVAEMGGIPVLFDVDGARARRARKSVARRTESRHGGSKQTSPIRNP